MSANPLLDKLRLPGERFKLPSGGLFYTNQELSDHTNNGEVQIYPMTTIDELLLKSPDRLLNGDAIEEVFKNCIPDILKPRELFQKDVDFILTCLRLVTFGSDADVELTHTCENAKKHSYIINLQKVLSTSKVIDPTTINKKNVVEFENGQKLVLYPNRYGDVIEMYKFIMADDVKTDKFDISMERKKLEETLECTLVHMIHSVDDITDKELIKEWITKIPAKWMDNIKNSIELINDWGPNFGANVTCKDCGEVFEINTPLNPVTFFL